MNVVSVVWEGWECECDVGVRTLEIVRNMNVVSVAWEGWECECDVGVRTLEIV